MYRSRRNYWALSKLGDWLRSKSQVPSPRALTLEEWDEYRKEHNKKLGYRLAESLDTIQDIVYYPWDVYSSIKWYITNRINMSHALISELEKGQWHDLSEVMLYANFDALKKFVEYEKAHMEYISHKEYTKKYLRSHRQEMGLKYLDWEISLGEESPTQSAAASEVKTLYLWWINRPRRELYYTEPYHSTLKYIAEKNNKSKYTVIDELEQKRNEVNQAMLHRLIDIRQSLWT